MNKLDKFFNNFNLRLSKRYPRDSKIYIYADYFELVSLFSKDTVISVSEMLDRLKKEGVFFHEKKMKIKQKQMMIMKFLLEKFSIF